MFALPPGICRAAQRRAEVGVGRQPPHRQPQRVVLVEDVDARRRSRRRRDRGRGRTRCLPSGPRSSPRPRPERRIDRPGSPSTSSDRATAHLPVDQVGDDRRPSERERSQPRPRGFAGGWPAQVQADVAGGKMIRQLGVARQIAGDEYAILRDGGDGFPRSRRNRAPPIHRASVATRARRARSRPSRRESASVAFPA